MKANVQDPIVRNTSGEREDALNERNLVILNLEAELLGEIAAIQESVRDAVICREWTDFEALLSSMKAYSERFEVLEAERVALFARFYAEQEYAERKGAEKKGGSEAGFYTLVSRLPEQDRKELTEMYRNVKLRTLKLRMANDSLMTYLNEARTTVDTFLEAALPERKGRMYSRLGTQIPTDVRSMVLNQSF
ncbi:MAG: hypothetical protein LBT13_07755 [Treponema sp.]|jgi:hypothetical protein|nr:hypothetical protein [Treponema sp.]